MTISAVLTPASAIAELREKYRTEMACQIVHDSLHSREGWTSPFILKLDDKTVGYGSLVIAGPWKGSRTLFEFYVLPRARTRSFDLFSALVETSHATAILAQTNDALLTPMLHTWCPRTASEKIIFTDAVTTTFSTAEIRFRKLTHEDSKGIFAHTREPVGQWGLDLAGQIIGTGGFLHHYNRPYTDIFMEIAPAHRRKGYGTFLVQELKRVCREAGNVPAARCDTADIASRRTIQKAGFAPCAHLLSGQISSQEQADRSKNS